MNIIIADDHKLIAKLFEKYLMSCSDINVVDVVYNGIDVLRSVKANDIDLVLCDISMPILDGMKTLKVLKENYYDLKVIMLSIHHEKWIIKKALKLGACGYISKESKKEEVLEAVTNASNDSIFLSNQIREIMKN